MATEFTTNYRLAKIDFNDSPWHDYLNGNMDVLDAVLFALTGIGNVKGAWANSTAYIAGDRVVDDADGTLWRCSVSHTSAASPTTFADDRTANPTYWESLSQTFGAATTWATGVAYTTNDFVVDAARYGVVTNNYTSGASYNADVAAGDIITLIDLSSGDLGALEALSTTGLAARTGSSTWATRTITGTANKVTVTNGNGVSGNPTLTIPDDVTLVNPTVTGKLRATATGDVTLAGDNHAGQFGPTSGANIAIDGNEIQGRNNGVAATLSINADGGDVNIGDASTTTTMPGDLVVSGTITGGQASFDAGTRMLFQQTAAPSGWTKETVHNNKALRLTTGTVGTGGSASFTSVFTSRTPAGSIGSTTAGGTNSGTALTTAQLPAHTHTFSDTATTSSNGSHTHTMTFTELGGSGSGGPQAENGGSGDSEYTETTSTSGSHTHSVTVSGTTSSTGSGSTHTHTFTGTSHSHTFTGTAMDFAVQYVDFIIAVKD